MKTIGEMMALLAGGEVIGSAEMTGVMMDRPTDGAGETVGKMKGRRYAGVGDTINHRLGSMNMMRVLGEIWVHLDTMAANGVRTCMVHHL
jgi:hypothetical protein